jgi:pimeloyl-ACP methyl ester carboxylesterase
MSIVQLPVSQWGIGDGPRVLLIHGLAGNRGTWWNLAEQLAGFGCTVVAPDLRGHGEAPSTSSYRFEDFSSDLAVLGGDWDLVIGHSLGGPIACSLAHRVSGVAALLLLDPVFEIRESDFEAVTAEQVAEVDSFAEPLAIASANPNWHSLDAFHKARAVRSVSDYTVEQVMYGNAPWSHRSLVFGLNRPVRILGGDPTIFAMLPPNLGSEIAATEPNVLFEVIRGSGHSIHRDAPHAVVNAAREMLGI